MAHKQTTMKFLVIIWAFVVVASAENCGSFSNLPSVSDRIRDNSANSPLNDMGGMAAVYKSKTDINPNTHICGACLISRRYLLTAAHCVIDNERSISISVGRDDLHNKNIGKEYSIDHVYIHPEYNRSINRYNDIAILQTQSEVEYSKIIWPFCLPDSNQQFRNYEAVEISGWGYTNQTHKASVLKTSSLRLLKEEDCAAKWRQHAPVLYDRTIKYSYPQGLGNYILCSGKDGVDACEGDSGGPMTYLNSQGIKVVIGIVARGISVCPIHPVVPGFNVNIAYYINWIHSITAPSQPPSTIRECPLSQGFFKLPSINACYRHFNDQVRTNDEARALCRREGLELARLQDQHALQIRKFIVEYIIGDKTSHIGARGGDDGIVRWDRDQVAVGSTNPLWYPGKPGSKVTKAHCLRLMTKRANLEGKSPGTPYWSESCDDLRYTLCEVTYL